MCRLIGCVAALCGLLVSGHALAVEAPQRLVLGTAAPTGSSWHQGLIRLAHDLGAAPGGTGVSVAVHAGGRAGADDRALLARLQAGELDLASVRAVALADAAPELAVLAAPGLVTESAHVARAVAALGPGWARALADKGLVVLAWADMGAISYFSPTARRMPESFAGETVYVADGDAGMRALADALHARYEAPGTPGVTCALRRGALGAVMATPEAVVRSAWFPHLRYRTRHVARREVGALVVRAGALAQLTAPQQSRLRQQAATWSAAWLDRSQRRIAADLNAVEPSAADLLARRLKPLSRVDLTSQEEAAWAFVYRQVQDSLVGTLYDAAGLDALRAAVQSPVMVVTDH